MSLKTELDGVIQSMRATRGAIDAYLQARFEAVKRANVTNRGLLTEEGRNRVLRLLELLVAEYHPKFARDAASGLQGEVDEIVRHERALLSAITSDKAA